MTAHPGAMDGSRRPEGGPLGADVAAQIAPLAVRARVMVEGALAGVHRNLHPGTSTEFTEHKEYAPGDDVRRIDWKAVGRSDRYTVKRFEDEIEMRAYLTLDASASMGYGRAQAKLAYASTLAAGLAYLLGRQGDATGMLLFDSATRTYLPPTAKAGQTREIFGALERAEPRGRTDLAAALGHLGDRIDKRSLVVVFTDLLDVEGDPAPGARAAVMDRLRRLAARGHDVALLHVLDPDEIELPFDDLVLFEGMEPGDGRTLLAQAAELRAAFRLESQAFRDRWRARCLEARVDYRLARTDRPPGDVLIEFLSGRQDARVRVRA